MAGALSMFGISMDGAVANIECNGRTWSCSTRNLVWLSTFHSLALTVNLHKTFGSLFAAVVGVWYCLEYVSN